MKPRILIASSVEGKGIADTIQVLLDHDFDCTMWDQAFPLSNTTIDTLLRNSSDNDFAIFVFSPDDVATIRQREYQIARDNVLFEAGLFMGMHGRSRAFVAVPRGLTDFHLPSDFLGFTVATYDAGRATAEPLAGLGATATRVRQAIRGCDIDSRLNIVVITRAAIQDGATYPLKLMVTFTNRSNCAVAAEGGGFIAAAGIPLARNASTDGGRIFPFRFFLGRDTAGRDIYENRCILEVGASKEAWIPIEPSFGVQTLEEALGARSTGTLGYSSIGFAKPLVYQDFEESL